jgi:hypothetical protein
LQETREKERGEGGATKLRAEEGGRKKKKKKQEEEAKREGGKRRRRRKLIGELCGSFKGF